MAGPPAIPHGWQVKSGYQSTSNPIEVGDPISAEDTPKTVWSVKDSNGDIVAACRVTVTDLTDDAQDSKIEFLVMVGGALVVAQTLNSAEA